MTGILALLFLFYVVFSVYMGISFSRRLKKITDYAHQISEERLQKIQAVNEEKNRILAILESMAEGVAVIDGDQRLKLVNSVLAKSLSLSKEQLEGRYFWEIFRDPIVNDMIVQSLQQHVSLHREHEILLSGTIFQIHVSPVLNGQDFLGAVAVFYDVTRLKQLETIRSEFVANVSHELKTPLTSIMGFVETLKEGAIHDDEHRMKFLQIIEDHSKKLYRLIEDLLMLSKIESGNADFKKESIDLYLLMSEVLEAFGPAVKSKKIKLDLKISNPFIIVGEPKLLGEVFSNLIDNAIKYNAEGGSIAIEAFCDAQSTQVTIKDSGMGIPAADLGRIFERFYRVDKSRSREFGGSGLGLSIAKHIIERHSGRIEVQSTLQKGSTFTVILPNAPVSS